MIASKPRKNAWVLLLPALAVVALWVLQKSHPDPSRENAANVDPNSSAATSPAGAIADQAADPLGEAGGTEVGRLHDALSALRANTDPEGARKILADLRAYLDSLPSGRAAARIARFLADPANDGVTGIDFAIGDGGFLAGPPTLRVALMDWLGQIDPRQAGLVAARILATPTHADEWAVSLRNYARANPTPDGEEFLRRKTEELIRNPAWREKPSVGFLESFDVLVHTRASSAAGLLSELVTDRSPAGKPLAYASFLTLDRLTQRDPAVMLEKLSSHPELAAARGEMVANLFARADVRDEAQRQLVRNYLLDSSRSGNELAAFAGIYPNANFMVSKNLLSENITLTGDEIHARDRAALAVMNDWLADPEFESVRSYLTTIQQRLTTFVGGSGR